jgi:hypothetical protein
MSEQCNHDEAAKRASEGERDARGRFVAGNKGGPGNPFGRRTAQLRKAMIAAVNDDDLQAIMAKMVELAKSGDVAAAKLVLAYAVGRPAEAADPDRVDVEEFQLYQQASAGAEAMGQVMEQLPVETACSLVRAVRPILAEAKRKDLLERFQQAEEEIRAEEEEPEEEPSAEEWPDTDEEDVDAVMETLRQHQEAVPGPSPIGSNGSASRRRQGRAAPSGNGTNGDGSAG